MPNKRYIELYKVRDFGQMIGDSVTFFFRNLGPLTRLFLTYIVPVFLVGSILFVLTGSEIFNFSALSSGDFAGDYLQDFAVGMGLLYVFLIFSWFVAITVVSAYMRSYAETEGEPDYTQIWDIFKSKIAQVTGFYLLVMLIIIIVVAVCVVIITLSSVAGGLLLFFASLWVIYFFNVTRLGLGIIVHEEDVSTLAAFSRSFKLIKTKWWLIFLAIVVTSLLVSFINYVFLIPFYIVIGVQSAVSVSEGVDMTMGSWGTFTFLFAMLGSLYTRAILTCCWNLGYYRCREEKEGYSISQKIETIGEVENKYFGNEGDF